MAESAMAGETDLVLLRPPPPKSLSLNDLDRLIIFGLMGVEVTSLELPKSPWPAAASNPGVFNPLTVDLFFIAILKEQSLRIWEFPFSDEIKQVPDLERFPWNTTYLSRNQIQRIGIVHTCSASTI